MFASLSLPRIAVVYANSKDAAGAVIHPTANTRFWKVCQKEESLPVIGRPNLLGPVSSSGCITAPPAPPRVFVAPAVAFMQSYQAVAQDICDSLTTLGLDAVTMPDGSDLVQRLAEQRIELVGLFWGGRGGWVQRKCCSLSGGCSVRRCASATCHDAAC